MKKIGVAVFATLMLGSVSAFAACTVTAVDVNANTMKCADGSTVAYGPAATFTENGKASNEAALDAGDVCTATYEPAPGGGIGVKVACMDSTPAAPDKPAGGN